MPPEGGSAASRRGRSPTPAVEWAEFGSLRIWAGRKERRAREAFCEPKRAQRWHDGGTVEKPHGEVEKPHGEVAWPGHPERCIAAGVVDA